LPANVGAQQGIAQQLVGAWTIVSWQDTAPNGTKRELTNPKGVVIFDAAGRYAQVVAREDRPKFKSLSEPTAEELAAATEDYFAANAGTWTVSEAEKLLILRFDAALRQDNEGAVLRSGAIRPAPGMKK
jgi:hypothetical protein